MRAHGLTVVAVLVAAAGGAVAGTQPTGTTGVDEVLSALFAVALTLVAARAAPPAIVVAATFAAAAGAPAAQVLAGVAAAMTIWRPAGPPAPLAAAALAVACLHLDWPEPFGATALVVAAVTALLVATAQPRFSRRSVAVALGATGGLIIVAGAGLGLTAGRHADDARLAVSLAEDGLDAVRAGETIEASEHFTRAEALLSSARRDLRRWWVRPATAVPVVAHQLRAVEHLADVAIEIAAAARQVASAADPSRLAISAGTLDLAVVGDLERPLLRLQRVIAELPAGLRAHRSPWLVGPLVDEMDELEARTAEELPHLATALDATAAAPWLLGEGHQRRYFVAVMTQSELRGGGGFVGNWGLLTATEGTLDLERFGRSDELERLGPFDIDVNPEWNVRYVDGWGVDRYFPRNSLSSPDLRTNAEAIRQASRQAGLGEIDGVLAIDPFTMAALLELTGPIEVAGWPEPLTAANAVEVLMFEQYLDPLDPERIDFLSNAAETLFEHLTTTALPEPARLADLLSPVAQAGHVQLTAFDPEVSDFLHRIGVEPRLEPPAGDSVLVRTANATPSKSDWFLRKHVAYDVDTRSTPGEMQATLTVTLENTAPPELPGGYFGSDRGKTVPENRQLVSVYSPFDAADATIDGEPVDLALGQEAGHRVHEAFVVVPPGGRSTLRLTLRGPVQSPYRLRIAPQPSVVPGDLRVVVDGDEVHDGPLDAIWELTHPE